GAPHEGQLSENGMEGSKGRRTPCEARHTQIPKKAEERGLRENNRGTRGQFKKLLLFFRVVRVLFACSAFHSSRSERPKTQPVIHETFAMRHAAQGTKCCGCAP